jgi:hypothetical protein
MNRDLLTYFCHYPDAMIQCMVGNLKWWQRIYIRWLLRPIMTNKIKRRF